MNRLPFIRPSSMPAIEACPGRALMEARACALVPAMRDWCSEPARQGTMGHAVLAGVFQDAFAGDWSQAASVIDTLPGRMVGIADWCKDAVRHCVSYGLDLVRNHVPNYQDISVQVEQHLEGDGIGVAAGGSADLILILGTKGVTELVVVVDWKTGFVSQGDAADHLQLACYAVMAADRWKPRHGVIVHLAMGRRREFTSALYDAEGLEAARQRIAKAALLARDPAPELRPSITACRYCKALAFCAAAREHIMTAADQFALFGAEPTDRVQLAQAAAIAKRFHQEADALAKHWRDERKNTEPASADS